MQIDSYPADQFQTDEPVSPAPSSKSKDGKKDKGDKKADKKDDKAKDKGKDDKVSSISIMKNNVSNTKVLST